MDINCGMELHFAETTNLEESDFVSSGRGLSETANLEESDFVSSGRGLSETANLEESDFVSPGTGLSERANLEESDFVSSSTELSDKLNLGANTEAVHHLLVLDQVSPPSRACADHDSNINDKHLSAADFKLDLGPANDLVSAADFPIENSVTDITSDATTEENSEGYSILNAALEGNPDLKQQMAPSRASISTIPTLPLASILPNLQAVQVVPIGNLQQLQLLTSGRPTSSDSTVAQLLSANQKMGQFLQLGSQQTANPKMIPLNLVQQGNSQVIGLSNSDNQKLQLDSNHCSADTTKTVQQLINLQSGSTSAFLLGNLLVLQPVASQLQGNMSLTQSSVTSLSGGNSLYTNNTLATLQPSCATSSNLISSEPLLMKIVPRPSTCTSSVTTSTSVPVQTCLSSVDQVPGQEVVPSVPEPLVRVNTTLTDKQMHSGKDGNKREDINDEATCSDGVHQEQEVDKTDSLKNSGRKNTKIVIYGKTISMTFDCRNKNGLVPSTISANKFPNNKNSEDISGGLNSVPGAVRTPLIRPGSDGTSSMEVSHAPTVQTSSTVNTSPVKYVSILEPNISGKLPGKADNVQTVSSTSAPVKVQNKLDVNKVTQLNPIKVNHGSSLTTCQGQSTSKGQVSHVQAVGQGSRSQNTVEEEVKISPQIELESIKDGSIMELCPIIQGGSRHEYRCDLCSASFNRYGNYTRHRMIHTVNTKDDYRYKCQECGRLFLQRCDMKRHMLIHTNEQPFRCNECGRGYIRRSDLVVHMRFHKKEKTFKCVYCSKNFYQSGDLNRHMRNIHLQTSMLTCGHCSRQFVKEATLIRHMQTKHRDIIIRTLKTKASPSNAENAEDQQPNINQDVLSDSLIKTENMEDVILNNTDDGIEDSIEDIIEESIEDGVQSEEDTTQITPTTDMDTSPGVIQFKGDTLTNQGAETEGQ